MCIFYVLPDNLIASWYTCVPMLNSCPFLFSAENLLFSEFIDWIGSFCHSVGCQQVRLNFHFHFLFLSILLVQSCLRKSFVNTENVCYACITEVHFNQKSIKKCQYCLFCYLWYVWIFICYKLNILTKPLKQYPRAHGRMLYLISQNSLQHLHQFKMKNVRQPWETNIFWCLVIELAG